jgi:hypothetical protein
MRKKNICTKIIKHTDIFCLFVYDSKPKMKTVMFSVLALSVVDCGFKAKTIKLVLAASPLSMQIYKEKTFLGLNQDNVRVDPHVYQGTLVSVN